MSDEIMQKLQEHDKKFAEHDKRFDQVDKRFDQVDKRFDQVDKRFDRVDQQIGFLAEKVLEHDEQFKSIKENMATKADIRGVVVTLDKLVGLVEKNDQEITMMSRGLQRVEDKLEEHDKDIKRLKTATNLA